MAEAAVAAPVATPNGPNVIRSPARRLFSPRATYAAIVARPRALGAFVITDRHHGRDPGAVLRHAGHAGSAAGPAGPDDRIVRRSRSATRCTPASRPGVARAPYTTPISLGVHHPASSSAITAAIILGIWGMLLGGAGTFKQVFAILAHSGIIPRCRVLFAMPLSYATGRMAGATLGRVRADGRGNVVHRAVPGRHRPVLDLVVRQRRHRRGRAVQAEDRRHRHGVPGDLRVRGPGARASCGRGIRQRLEGPEGPPYAIGGSRERG